MNEWAQRGGATGLSVRRGMGAETMEWDVYGLAGAEPGLRKVSV